MDKPKSTINILHLISSFEVGGIEKMLVNFLKNFSESDFKYTLVVMNNSVDENLKNELLSTGHNIYFLDRKKGHLHPKYIFKLLKIIKQHNIDIIHSHNFGSKFWSILCKLLLPRLKLVFCFSDTNIANKFNKFHVFIQNLAIDKNICISKSIYQECAKAGITKLIQIYYGINTDNLRPISKKIYEQPLNIINVARITHLKKGQDILIKALKICKDKGMKLKCNFVGGICDKDKISIEYLKKLTKELGLDEEVSFSGNRSDIPSLLAESDLFILPSRYEGLGLVLLETMAAGLPIIASNIDGPAELIRHGKNGLLFQNDNEFDLAEKIYSLYKNPEEMFNLAENGQNFVKNFDILKMCSNYHQLYKDLLDDKSSKSVLMIGSDTSVKGGMSTIINLYAHNGLFETISTFLPSHKDGNLIFKTLFFINFLIKYLFILFFSTPIKIVHVHSSYNGSFFRKAIILHLAKVFGKKTIFHLNGSRFNIFYENSSGFIKALIRHTLNKTDLIIVVSKQWKKDIEAKQINSRIEILYNPVLVPKIQKEKEESELINVLFMGKICHRKGAYDIVEAAKLIKDPRIKITLYGDGETQKFKDLVENFNLEQNIRIEDWISDSKINEVYQNADIYILPSYNEGLPLSVLEAVSNGIPVITTNIGGIPEAVKNEVNGFLIEPGDYNLLAEKIILLADNKLLRNQMGAAGYKIAKEKFDVNIIINQLTAFYKELYRFAIY
ncbi:MAG: glycosyltransferase [Candidatus Gastranaerophilales bacterium]|nr:glycosyltransferase [Candidatus Gastranaerophilales bacterium]